MNTNENAKALNDDELVSVSGGAPRTIHLDGRGNKAIVRSKPLRGAGVAILLDDGTVVDTVDSVAPRMDPYSHFVYFKINYTDEEGKLCEGWIDSSLI